MGLRQWNYFVIFAEFAFPLTDGADFVRASLEKFLGRDFKAFEESFFFWVVEWILEVDGEGN
jgi:hypothetical protein